MKRTKDYWAAGFMNINQVVCVRSNWFAEIKTGTMIAVYALAPPTNGEPGSS